MARLIDADDVLQRFIQESEYSGVNVVHINTIKRILQDIDTAYDVEKVVEEIKKMKVETNTIESRHHNTMIGVCVDIVRKGGVE